MFLDYAEDQARRRKQVFLSDWQVKLMSFSSSTNVESSKMRRRVARGGDQKAET